MAGSHQPPYTASALPISPFPSSPPRSRHNPPFRVRAPPLIVGYPGPLPPIQYVNTLRLTRTHAHHPLVSVPAPHYTVCHRHAPSLSRPPPAWNVAAIVCHLQIFPSSPPLPPFVPIRDAAARHSRGPLAELPTHGPARWLPHECCCDGSLTAPCHPWMAGGGGLRTPISCNPPCRPTLDRNTAAAGAQGSG